MLTTEAACAVLSLFRLEPSNSGTGRGFTLTSCSWAQQLNIAVMSRWSKPSPRRSRPSSRPRLGVAAVLMSRRQPRNHEFNGGLVRVLTISAKIKLPVSLAMRPPKRSTSERRMTGLAPRDRPVTGQIRRGLAMTTETEVVKACFGADTNGSATAAMTTDA
jgi:hypothetical protein